MARRTTKPAAPKLTSDQRDKVYTLAKLGQAITPADVAKILDVSEQTITRFLASPTGKKLWAKARAEGRAELITIIRQQALEGSAAAQKQLAALIEYDTSANPLEQRVRAKEVREVIGRSASAVNGRVRRGEMVPTGPDSRYEVAALIALIPTLWDHLAEVRAENAKLRRLTESGRVEEAEARRQALVEKVRRQRRENDIAEGHLMQAEDVRDEVARLSAVLKDQSANLAQEITLKLGLEGAAAATVSAARAAFLRRCVADMGDGAP